MKGKSVLQAYIDNSQLLNTMSTIVTAAINGFPKNLQENESGYEIFQKYLQNFWSRDFDLPKVLRPIVGISQDIIIEAFKLLDDYFPIQTFISGAPEEDMKSNTFLGRLPSEERKTFF